MDSISLAQEDAGDGMSFNSFADVVSGVASTGNSTRDGIFTLISQGINVLPQLFNRNQQPQQQLPAPTFVDPNQVGAGLQVGVGNGGVNLGGGLQLNTTTLLIAGLAAALLLRK